MTKLDERSSRKLKIRMHGILNSTMVSAVGYDLATKTLRVKFKKGAIYDYRRVPTEVFCKLMGAGSIGLGMHANIFDKYKFVIVSKPKEISVEEIVEIMKETEDEKVVAN